jgi:hypothetical protein
MFATASGLLLGVRAYDTQCGAKVFRRSAVAEIFGEPFISRWIFDVEIYCRMGHARILEYPVKEWRDVPGSKVRIGREMFRVGGDLLRIRKVYGRAEGWRISSSRSTVASSQLKNTKPNA